VHQQRDQSRQYVCGICEFFLLLWIALHKADQCIQNIHREGLHIASHALAARGYHKACPGPGEVVVNPTGALLYHNALLSIEKRALPAGCVRHRALPIWLRRAHTLLRGVSEGAACTVRQTRVMTSLAHAARRHTAHIASSLHWAANADPLRNSFCLLPGRKLRAEWIQGASCGPMRRRRGRQLAQRVSCRRGGAGTNVAIELRSPRAVCSVVRFPKVRGGAHQPIRGLYEPLPTVQTSVSTDPAKALPGRLSASSHARR